MTVENRVGARNDIESYVFVVRRSQNIGPKKGLGQLEFLKIAIANVTVC